MVVAVVDGAILGRLSRATQEQWGFGLHDVWQGRFYTAITSTFFVRDLRMFVGILLLIGYSVGIYEWLAGTRRALLLYWVTNVGGFLLATLLVVGPLYWAGTIIGYELAFINEVGPSAGAFGCIGGWVNHLPARYRRWAFVGITVGLAGKLVLFPEPFADTVHLIAFSLGFTLDGRLWGNARHVV